MTVAAPASKRGPRPDGVAHPGIDPDAEPSAWRSQERKDGRGPRDRVEVGEVKLLEAQDVANARASPTGRARGRARYASPVQ